VYGRNLLNTLYKLGTDANAFGEWRIYGEPRVIGVRAGFRY
jgi:hypothetical protein